MGRTIDERTSWLIPIRELSVFEAKELKLRKGKWLLCLCEACGKEHRISKSNFPKVKSCGCRKYHSSVRHGQWSGCGEISKTLYSTMRGTAEHRGLTWSVTIDFLWELFLRQDKKCAISGVSITLPNASRGLRTASLDRIDSRLGYEPNNVQWVHSAINIMKWSLPTDEFIQWCRLVASNTQSKTLEVAEDYASAAHARTYHPGQGGGRLKPKPEVRQP